MWLAVGRSAAYRGVMTADDILPTYERVAAGFDRSRGKSLFERAWLDRALAHAPGKRVLDLGCGSGRPIAQYLSERRCQVTGVDGAAAMVDLFEGHLPHAEVFHADMHGLDLQREFDIVLAWNSFFHLKADDQRAMFAVFAAHCTPGGVLMFTSGTSDGEVTGHVEGEPVYHASLAPAEYEALLQDAGFMILDRKFEDPDCQGHSVWLLRRKMYAFEKPTPGPASSAQL
jgi:SAM-dependent methyltransferase